MDVQTSLMETPIKNILSLSPRKLLTIGAQGIGSIVLTSYAALNLVGGYMALQPAIQQGQARPDIYLAASRSADSKLPNQIPVVSFPKKGLLVMTPYTVLNWKLQSNDAANYEQHTNCTYSKSSKCNPFALIIGLKKNALHTSTPFVLHLTIRTKDNKIVTYPFYLDPRIDNDNGKIKIIDFNTDTDKDFISNMLILHHDFYKNLLDFVYPPTELPQPPRL